MKLIAKKSLRYAGRSLVAGDEFEASAKDARLLRAIGKASDAVDSVVAAPVPDEPEKKKPSKYRTRRMNASDDVDEQPEDGDEE